MSGFVKRETDYGSGYETENEIPPLLLRHVMKAFLMRGSSFAAESQILTSQKLISYFLSMREYCVTNKLTYHYYKMLIIFLDYIDFC